MNLFVLVSTGQKVANLPPVLEHSRPGDHALWVESDEAGRANWTDPPRSLLEDRGLFTADTVRVPHLNDPVSLAAALGAFAAAARGQYEAVFLVANGGTKLSPVGLLNGLSPLAPRLLYGDERPAVHSLYPAALDAPPEVRPYRGAPDPDRPAPLDLPDVLRLSGYTFASDSRHVRLWPEELPADFGHELYGADEEHTYALHAAHHARAAVPPAGERVPYADLQGLARAAFVRWERAVAQVRAGANPQALAGLYHGTLNLDEAARWAAGQAAAGAAPPPRIDDAFERAVGRRVRRWLADAGHPGVRSAWANVAVARQETPHRRAAEFDILLVLTNGVLVHLECKSAAVDVRDLDARLHRLRETGSQLARLAVVLPLYSARAGQPWFPTMHQARREAEAARLAVLPFTWPGQPPRYPVPGADPAEEAECPGFEGELDRLLRPYRP
jgi:hypothetical protein